MEFTLTNQGVQSVSNTSFQWYGPYGSPVVVLVHGLGLTRDLWQSQISSLSARFRVLSYDLYGHGKSGPPPSPPSLSVFSQQLASVLESADVMDCAVVGFSMGGMIARRFAQDYPARISALAILNSPHKRTAEQQDVIDARAAQITKDREGMVDAALERWFTPEYRMKSPDTMARFRACLLENDPAVYAANFRVLDRGMDEIIAPDPPISCPTLVMTGEEDTGSGPEMTRAIASEIAGAEAVILPTLRHMALIENPAAVNNVLVPFLSRHLARSSVRDAG